MTSSRISAITSFFSPTGIDRGCQVISGFGRHLGLTETRSHAGIDLMSDKMNLDLKLLYCEFQKYGVMTISVVGGQPKKHVAQIIALLRIPLENSVYDQELLRTWRQVKFGEQAKSFPMNLRNSRQRVFPCRNFNTRNARNQLQSLRRNRYQ